MAFVLMGRALQIKDMLMGLDLTFWGYLAGFLVFKPRFLLIMMPVSAMLAVFLTFLRMGADKELIALKAGGISLYQMSGAPLFFRSVSDVIVFLGLFFLDCGWGEQVSFPYFGHRPKQSQYRIAARSFQ